MKAVGDVLPSISWNETASAQVLTASPLAAVIVTLPFPLNTYVPSLFHCPAFCR